MKFLLDVNILVALGSDQHEHHRRALEWVTSMDRPTLATCSITELGFVRVSSGISAHASTVSLAKEALVQLKQISSLHFVFLPDDVSASSLPIWVKGHKQVTEGHLSALAAAHGYRLATFDKSIPGAFVVPS